MIVTHKDLEQICEAIRFKKRVSSEDFTESSTPKLYTSHDPDRRFIFLALLWIGDCMNSCNIFQNIVEEKL